MVLADHLSQTEKVFRVGNKSYSRWMLQSTISVCMSCHTQLPAGSRHMTDFEATRPYTNEFDQAEFLFATRSFAKASDLYKQIILEYPSNNARANQVETALEREVAYYSRVKRDPEGAIAALEKYQKNKKLAPYLKKNIDSWISQFKSWKKTPTIDPLNATEEQILKFAKSNLDSDSKTTVLKADSSALVTYLKVSGILYEYLQSHPKTKIVPQILYWLSICDRSISNTFFFSLADLYLRECVMTYPRDPVAKKCFKEYEEQTILSYTGSSGINVPESVRDELNTLRKLVEGDTKIKIQ